PVTRAQAVTFLYNMAGRPAAGSEPFDDVNEGDYFAVAVAWAYENGITSGTSETKFSPDAECLRCEIVTFLYQVYGAE
ncbi:MAG: S-layer homology domain-containing protein, partial [Firmicutes bacterium]|nr:S-layer homology domain-containing protein [Bacillota bacterium]